MTKKPVTNWCLHCDTPIKGRRKKCDPCRDLCNMCGKPARRVPSGNLYCPPCHGVKVASRTYNVTLDEALELRTRSGCDVCGDKGTSGKGLNIDHDHATGRVRGILCHGCNLALGLTKDNPELLRSLAAYLEKN